jgi:hypothetical protein
MISPKADLFFRGKGFQGTIDPTPSRKNRFPPGKAFLVSKGFFGFRKFSSKTRMSSPGKHSDVAQNIIPYRIPPDVYPVHS